MNGTAITVLIIDDDIAVRKFVTDLLIARGYKVISAVNGIEGLKIIQKEKVDIVVSDLIMPEKEGIETIKEIKSSNPEIKIVAMSGSIYKDTFLKAAKGIGAHEIVHKPFRNDEIIEAIENVYQR